MTTDLDTAITLVNPDLPLPELAERIGEALNAFNFFEEQFREKKARLQAAMMECVRAHGPIDVGDMRYVISTPKTTKCANVLGAARALIGGCGGDFDTFCQLLTSQPFKHGACREVLPADVYETIFVTEARDKLDAKPVVAGIPTKYVKARSTT